MITLFLLTLLLQTPQDIYKAASADMVAGRWAEAALKFEQILKDDPAHIPSNFNLAVCYSKAGNTAGAEQLYRKVVEQDPDVYEARVNLGIILYQANNIAAADHQFTQASRIRPMDPLSVLYRARILDKRGDSVGAAENYRRALELNPTDQETRVSAGLFYLKLQQADKAYPLLIAAEQQGFRSPLLFIALSEAEHLRKNEEKSRAYLEQAVTLDPGNQALRLELGIVYREAGLYDKAIEVLEPLGTERNFELALSYLDRKDFAKALPLLQSLTAKEPLNLAYLYMLGKSQIGAKQYAKAIISLQQVLKAKPSDLQALSSLASTYQLQDDWGRAVPVIERFIQLKPRDAFAFFMLAISYDRLGNMRQAFVNYNKFLELDDNSNDVRSFQARQRAKTLERRLKK